MEAQLRIGVAAEADVRVALVVAVEDVVARLLRLDQVVLEQQRLALGARHRRLDARDLRDHRRDARLVAGLLEIVRDALLEVASLADVERLARPVEHPVHARPVRQRLQELARVERRRRRRSAGPADVTFDRRGDLRHAAALARAYRGALAIASNTESEHRRRQPSRIGVVAAAMVAVEQRNTRRRRVEPVPRAVREREIARLQAERAQRRLVRDPAKREDRGTARQRREIGGQIAVAVGDLDRQRLVLRRQAFHCVGDPATDRASSPSPTAAPTGWFDHPNACSVS